MVLARSAEDLGALRIFDPDFPERVVVAAGRAVVHDRLRPGLAHHVVDGPDRRSRPGLGVLQTLARFQGKDIDPRTTSSRADPARDALRRGAVAVARRRQHLLRDGRRHAAVRDAAGRAAPVGLARERWRSCCPNAERALEWIERFGDADGDGYVEYHRATDRGLVNQGWKDSWDGIRYADGTVATAPIALCEVQAYVYSAYLARAHFAQEAGDEATFDRYGPRRRSSRPTSTGTSGWRTGLVRRRSRPPTSARSTR
jgi:hypothetical protein